jgi:hypothetical protein
MSETGQNVDEPHVLAIGTIPNAMHIFGYSNKADAESVFDLVVKAMRANRVFVFDEEHIAVSAESVTYMAIWPESELPE